MHPRNKECSVYTEDGDEYVLSIRDGKDGDKFAVLHRVKRLGVFRFTAYRGTFREERETTVVVPNVTSATRPTKGEPWTVDGIYNGIPYSLSTTSVECVYDGGVFPSD
jgi:hypothetical protein